MPELNFITIGDRKFFPIIKYNAIQIQRIYPFAKIFVYDWGFDEIQKKYLLSFPEIILIDWSEKLNLNAGYKEIYLKYEGYNPNRDVRKREYLFNQKPLCILDSAARINQNLIYIDGDAILINPLDELFKENFDIGVTVLSREVIKKAQYLDIKTSINAGVIFFLTTAKNIQNFVSIWLKEIQNTRRVWIEQTALNNLIQRSNTNIYENYYSRGTLNINGQNLRTIALPYTLYNFTQVEKGFDLDNTKIIHLKGRVLKLRKVIIEFKLRFFLKRALKIFPPFLGTHIINDILIRNLAKCLTKPGRVIKILKLFFSLFNITTLRGLAQKIS